MSSNPETISPCTSDTVRMILTEFVDRAGTSQNVILTTDNPEGPHRLRVSLRRLRTALGVFGDGSHRVQSLRTEARWLGSEVGKLRDLEVARDDVVLPRLEKRADHTGLQGLIMALNQAILSERRNARETLAGDRARRMLDDLRRLVNSADDLLDRPAAPHAETAVNRRFKKARKIGRRLHELDAVGRHDFRKELKKLRYTCEFGAFLGAGIRRDLFLKRLKRVQDGLGAMNDAVVAQTVLLRVTESGTEDTRRAARALSRRQAKRAKKSLKPVTRHWKQVANMTRLF